MCYAIVKKKINKPFPLHLDKDTRPRYYLQGLIRSGRWFSKAIRSPVPLAPTPAKKKVSTLFLPWKNSPSLAGMINLIF